MPRPASATDKEVIDQASIVLQHARDHFRRLRAVKKACDIKPAIAYLMEAGDAPARAIGRVQGADNGGCA